MSLAALTPDAKPGRLERAALVGLLASLVAVAGATAQALTPRPLYAFGPADFTAWVTAICGAVGTVAATANGLALLVHRWRRLGRPPVPRRPRKRKEGGPDAAVPHPGA